MFIKHKYGRCKKKISLNRYLVWKRRWRWWFISEEAVKKVHGCIFCLIFTYSVFVSNVVFWNRVLNSSDSRVIKGLFSVFTADSPFDRFIPFVQRNSSQTVNAPLMSQQPFLSTYIFDKLWYQTNAVKHPFSWLSFDVSRWFSWFVTLIWDTCVFISLVRRRFVSETVLFRFCGDSLVIWAGEIDASWRAIYSC